MHHGVATVQQHHSYGVYFDKLRRLTQNGDVAGSTSVVLQREEQRHAGTEHLVGITSGVSPGVEDVADEPLSQVAPRLAVTVEKPRLERRRQRVWGSISMVFWWAPVHVVQGMRQAGCRGRLDVGPAVGVCEGRMDAGCS